MRKNNKFLSFIKFNMALMVIFIFIVVVITALDMMGMVTVPEKYSLTKYLIVNKEVNIDKDLLIEIDKFYYLQLDEYGKIIYKKIYANQEKMKTGTFIIDFGEIFNDLLEQENGKNILEQSFNSALTALFYDNPEMFFVDLNKICIYTETRKIFIIKKHRVYIGPEEGDTYLTEEFNSELDVEIAIKNIKEEAQNIKNMLAGNDYLKIKAIHNYLIDNLEYDQTISKANIYDIYGGLVNKVAVCEGYAKSLKYILDDIGINCIFVCGIGTNSKGESENHAWNYVELDGNWYAIDVTWDDPIIIGNGWLTDEYRYKYFLNGSNKFYKDHKEDGNIIDGVKFYYPVLSQKNY